MLFEVLPCDPQLIPGAVLNMQQRPTVALTVHLMTYRTICKRYGYKALQRDPHSVLITMLPKWRKKSTVGSVATAFRQQAMVPYRWPQSFTNAIVH